MDKIKKLYDLSPDKARETYQELFYYYDGIVGTRLSQSVHAAGIVVSPITLADHYGCFWKDGELLLNIDMEEIHEVSLVKFDLLILNNIGIIQDTCKLAGIPYPKSHEINWNDQVVWADMMRSPVGIFQMEGDFAFKLLKDFGTHSIFDMSLVTACIRPSGASYRNDLIAHKVHHNPSPIIDELLKDNHGYLIYQEDTIKFLQQICGMSGSEADNVRRAIGRKDEERLRKALPQILDGYCAKSERPREVAEQEAKEFLKIIEDSASYQFGYNHSIGYCMVGYICAWLRCYCPGEFITTYLNHAKNSGDIENGTALARTYKIPISPPRFGLSASYYSYNKGKNVISKGLSSIKGYGVAVCDKLYDIGQLQYEHFVDVLDMLYTSSIKAANIEPLIKIDYFERFGNCVELAKILSLYDVFRPSKPGGKKTVKKEKIDGTPLEYIVQKYGTGLTSKGAEAKQYTITDTHGFLVACEEYIKDAGFKDANIKVKMQNQKDILGYIDITTNKKEDRRKLLVLDIVPQISKQNGEVWGYRAGLRSIGSGKSERFTIRKYVYDQCPIMEGDIIFAPPHSTRQNKAGYWCLDRYQKSQ